MALFSRQPVVLPTRGSIGRPRVEIPALTASAVKIQTQKEGDYRRLIQPWQQRALSFYDLVGECWFAAQFYARSLSQVRIYAAELTKDGEVVETKDEKANEAVARIQDPGGGRSQFLGSYGRLMFITGEGYCLVTEEDGIERWEFVSSDELRIDGSGVYTRFSAPSLTAEQLKNVPDDAFFPVEDEEQGRKLAAVYRFWRPHPRYSALADSPLRATLDILEELLLLTLAVRARAKSRISGPGLLLIPEEVSPAPPTVEGDEDPLNDPFLEELIEAMVSPITDEGTASAVVPLVVRGQAEYLSEIRRVAMQDPMETYPEEGLRSEAIRRFAMGADFPPEILLGLTEANHWTGWQIDEQTAKSHIFPVCQQFVDSMTGAYLRPFLKSEGVADWEKYVIAYDGASVVNKPDKAKDAKDLHDRLVISDAALRDAGGHTDADAPSEEELKRRIGLELKDKALAVGDEAALEPTPEMPTAEVQSGEEGAADEEAPQSAAEVMRGQPEDGTQAMAAAACQMAILRGREIAGAKIRKGVLDKTGDYYADVANSSLVSAAGPELTRQISQKAESELVDGCTLLLQRMFAEWKIDQELGDLIAAGVKNHTVKTIYAVPKVALELPPGVKALLAKV